ncbi:MAG: isochorismatase family cysteine hydrolase [bacterium]
MRQFFWALSMIAVAGCANGPVATRMANDSRDPRLRELTPDLFQNAVLISVDIQNGQPGPPLTADTMDPLWASYGFTPEDVNAASDYFFGTALPNAAKIARLFRERNIPVILIHWGARFQDGMDLDPEVRSMLLEKHGTNFERWGHRERDAGSQVHPDLDPQPSDYILPKTAQDAFISSNIGFMLKNIGAKNLFLMGGHAGACLGKTSKSAKEAGYTTICIEDATNDATESRRIPNINEVGYDIICRTEDILRMP